MKVKLEDIHETKNRVILCFSEIGKKANKITDLFFGTNLNQKGTLDLTKEEALEFFNNNPFLKEGDILEINIKKAEKAKSDKNG